MTESLPAPLRKSWSLSSWGTYEGCPAAYKYRYIEKRPSARGAAATRGVSNHAVIEGFIKGELTALTDDLSFYNGFLTYVKSLENYPEHRVSVKRDWSPCAWEDPDVWYKGILDCLVFPRPEEAVVFDWKTGKIYPDHDDQKSIYSLAVLSSYPAVRSVRAVHVYLDLGKNREKTFHRDEVHMLRDFWQSRVRKLESDNQFIPTPSFRCTRCPFSRSQGGPCQF
jgi:hypothetical protein